MCNNEFTEPMTGCLFRTLAAMLLTFNVAADIIPADLRNAELLASEQRTLVPGVEYRRLHFKELYGDPLSICLVIVDWDKANVKAGLKFSGTFRRKTSAMAREAGAIAAINGGYHTPRLTQSPLPYFSLKINGQQLDCSHPGGDGTVAFSGNELPFVGKFRKELLEKYDNVLSADGLVLDGRSGLEAKGAKAPHTGIGLTAKRQLILITIDGRQKDSVGVNLGEMAELMIKLGCVSAISLDGGGSTTMFLSDTGVVNHPSDNTGERPICDVFFIAPATK